MYVVLYLCVIGIPPLCSPNLYWETLLGLGDEMKMCPLGDPISTLAKLRVCVYLCVGVSKRQDG